MRVRMLVPLLALLSSSSLLACTNPESPSHHTDGDAGGDARGDSDVLLDGAPDATPDAAIVDGGGSLDDVTALVPDPSSVVVTRWLGICVSIDLLFADGTERRARPGEVTFEPTAEFAPAPWLTNCGGVAVQGRAEGMFTVAIAAGSARSAFRLEVLPAEDVSVECAASDRVGQGGFLDGVGTPLLLNARALGRGVADPSAMRVRIEPATRATFAPISLPANPAVFGALRIAEVGEYTIVCEWTGDGEVLGSGSEERVAVPARTAFDVGIAGRSIVRAGDSWFSSELSAGACTELELLTTQCLSGRTCERHVTDPGTIAGVDGGSLMGRRVCAGEAGEVRASTRRDSVDTEAFFWISGSVVEDVEVAATGALTREFDIFLLPVEMRATVTGRSYEVQRSPLVSIALSERAVLVGGQDWTHEVGGHPGSRITLSLHGGSHPFSGKLALNLENGEGLSETDLGALQRELAGARVRFSVRYPNHRGGGGAEPVVEFTVPE